ncbi:MAG: hypothetical protein ACI8W7_001148 [Gammaproteobacteria bacterium]|jgi:hypothetical protein
MIGPHCTKSRGARLKSHDLQGCVGPATQLPSSNMVPVVVLGAQISDPQASFGAFVTARYAATGRAPSSLSDLERIE